MKRTRAQVSLELSTAFIAICLLLLGSIKLSTWLIGRFVARQHSFEASREQATDNTPGSGRLGVEVDETSLQPLRFF